MPGKREVRPFGLLADLTIFPLGRLVTGFGSAMRGEGFKDSADGVRFSGSDGGNPEERDRSDPHFPHLGDFEGALASIAHGCGGAGLRFAARIAIYYKLSITIIEEASHASC